MNHTLKLLLTNIVSLLLIVIFSTLLSILGNQLLVRIIPVDPENYYYYHFPLLEHFINISIGVLIITFYWKCLILLKNIIVKGVFSFNASFGTEIAFVIVAFLIMAISGAGLAGVNKIDLYIFKNLLVFFIAAVSLPILEHKMKDFIFPKKSRFIFSAMNRSANFLITNIVSLLITIFLSAALLFLGNQILTRFIKVDSANAYIYELTFFEQITLSAFAIILIFTYSKCLILIKNIITKGVFTFNATFRTEIAFAIVAYFIFAIGGAALAGANKIDLYIFKNLLVFFIAAVALPALQHKMSKITFHRKADS